MYPIKFESNLKKQVQDNKKNESQSFQKLKNKQLSKPKH